MRFAIVVAAGQGRRMGYKKQFLDLEGWPMWLRSVEAMFLGGAENVIVVAGADDLEELRHANMAWSHRERTHFTLGGETRHESVTSGVRYIMEEVRKRSLDVQRILIAIHDAARPFVSADDVNQTFMAASRTGAALLGHYCRDTVKWVEDDCAKRTLPREQLFLAETPQVIRGDGIYQAYIANPVTTAPTDDSALFESLGMTVTCVESTSYNGKVTTPADLEFAQWLAKKLWGSAEHV